MSDAALRLLADVLELQVDMTEPALIDARLDDWRNRLRAGLTLSAEDAALLWRSPDARAALFDLRAELAFEALSAWRMRGYASEVSLLAADGAADARTVDGAGFTVRMHRSPARGHWTVSLVIAPEALDIVPAGLSVRLADSGGLVWLEGALDRTGGVDAYWAQPRETPVERLRGHTLRLDFC